MLALSSLRSSFSSDRGHTPGNAPRAGASAAPRIAMTETGGTGVAIRGASKHYGEVRALDDVTLAVAPGEFVSLLGPSGSGKTTLLGILGGFIQPSAGEILFGETDVT